MLGHLAGDGGRLLDLVVRSAGPVCGGLPEPGPESLPGIYSVVFPPPGACPLCGFNHKDALPHEPSPVFQMNFFARHGRRATMADTMSHCSEPVQAEFVKLWDSVGAWPVQPPGWTPPDFYRVKLEATLARVFTILERDGGGPK